MVWYLIFAAGLALVLAGAVKALRTRQPDMLMLIGGVVAFVGWVGISAGLENTHQTAQLAAYQRWLVPGAGAAALAWAAYQFFANLGALRWPSVSATVLTSERVAHHTAKQQYGVQVRYRYSVSGRTYESTRRATDTEEPLDGFAADQVVARYPKGASVTAYYDPQHPASACLERSWLNGRWLVPALIGVLLLWAGLR